MAVCPLKNLTLGSSHRGSLEMNPTSIHEDAGLIPGLAQWVKDLGLPMSCGVVADEARIWCFCGCGVGWQATVLI